MVWPMATIRSRAALAGFSLLVAACAGTTESQPTEITRALLPPTPAEVTTTTTMPIDPLAADRIAQQDIGLVLEAAEDLFAERGAFDASPAEMDRRTPTVDVIGLEEAALRRGVVFDAFDQRATLYAMSESGTWFCVDISDNQSDHGFGDSFQLALAACTDGTIGSDWGDPFSPTGPDEAAIESSLGALAGAMARGEPDMAHLLFAPHTACEQSDMSEAWPAGLALADGEAIQLDSIVISGEQATATAEIGSLARTSWQLIRNEGTWRLSADPCQLLESVLAERKTEEAAELLEAGLFAVRSAFVNSESFAFSDRRLAEIDENLLFVPMSEASFGHLSYSGSESRGLLVTVGAPETFYCAVESLSAPTVHATGASIDEVKTANRCISRAES